MRTRFFRLIPLAAAACLLTTGPASALSQEDLEKAGSDADQRAKEAGEIDIDSEAAGGGDQSGKVGTGCIQRAGHMSLLGVEYQGGIEVPKGSLQRLSTSNPALVALHKQDEQLEQMHLQEQKDLVAQGYSFLGGWDGAVKYAQNDLDDAEAELSARLGKLREARDKKQELVDGAEKYKADLSIAFRPNYPGLTDEEKAVKIRADVEQSYQRDLAYRDEDIARAQARVDEYKPKLGPLNEKLSGAQKGLEKHNQAFTPATAARDAANKLALEEAAKCD